MLHIRRLKLKQRVTFYSVSSYCSHWASQSYSFSVDCYSHSEMGLLRLCCLAVLSGPFSWRKLIFFSGILDRNKEGVEFRLLSNKHRPKQQAYFYRQKLLPLSGKGKDFKFLRFSGLAYQLQHWKAFAATSVNYVGTSILAFIAACLDRGIWEKTRADSQDCGLCTFLGAPYCSLQSGRVTFSIDSGSSGAWLSLPSLDIWYSPRRVGVCCKYAEGSWVMRLFLDFHLWGQIAARCFRVGFCLFAEEVALNSACCYHTDIDVAN